MADSAAISPCDLQGGKDGGNRALQIAGADCHGQKGLADCEARLSAIFAPCGLRGAFAAGAEGAFFKGQERNWNVEKPKYALHLFAGAGGGILADLIGGETWSVCAVEIEDYPQRILAARFPDLPVWDDVCTFCADNPECAGMFADLRIVADELVIAGGFPCQDISCAGKGAGLRGARSGLWREYARIVCEIRPRFVFVENSTMLVSRGLGDVLGDLAAMGYDAAWCVLSASGVGAMHKRDRIWIAAIRNDNG